MKTPQAILIGASLIALSVMIVSAIRPAEAQQHGGPYQLMHHSNALANAGVFRLDTSSGEVSYCYITADNSLTCSKGVR